MRVEGGAERDDRQQFRKLHTRMLATRLKQNREQRAACQLGKALRGEALALAQHVHHVEHAALRQERQRVAVEARAATTHTFVKHDAKMRARRHTSLIRARRLG